MDIFSTPMMKQYMDIKKKYQDCLLLYRMGDFYELFMEDAHIGAKVLNITLTSKRSGKDGKIPMAGVPYHAIDIYLGKLVKAGYKVALCEQLSPPNKGGLVDRDVIRIVTPGTILDENALDKKDNNYIVSLTIEKNIVAISIADISTGYFATTETAFDNLKQVLEDELFRLNPSECILPEHMYNNPEILTILKKIHGLNIYCFNEWNTYSNDAQQYLKKYFAIKTLASFGIEEYALAIQTSAALLGYLQHTQKGKLEHIKKITTLLTTEFVLLDRSTIINLELFSTIRQNDTKGTLLYVLDETITALGGRLLKQWMRKPLISKKEIVNRYDVVELYIHNRNKRIEVRKLLEEITDIERIISRLSVHIGNPRDLINLKFSLKKIIHIKKFIHPDNTLLLTAIEKSISPEIKDVISMIENTITDEPPIELKQGGIIKKGINNELDTLRETVQHSKTWLVTLEKKERESTGITSLKIRFNKIFGFYIEISKANAHLVPHHYIRKQTLVNGERFITPELKKHEEIILSAEEKINDLEYKLFSQVLTHILSYTQKLQLAAYAIAQLDCLTTFSHIAEKNRYTRPKLLYSGEIRIKEGRHPVVEKSLEQDNQFVPNDVCLDNISQQLLMITGPNMAGKSVFIRQVALIIFMAQIGCFVPASSAYVSIVDRIFVRSGASDMITSGLSTFMVEMVETAYILHYATKKSFIVMDEIGRGTSTYDGISLAWAIAEYLATNFTVPPKTLFATHYHELQALEKTYPKKIKNFHMAVSNEKDEPIFLHTLFAGSASHSFGIAVAKLAGIPSNVIEKAKIIQQSLENRTVKKQEIEKTTSSPAFTITDSLIRKELESIDISTITPLQALNKLAELKSKSTMYQQKLDTLHTAD